MLRPFFSMWRGPAWLIGKLCDSLTWMRQVRALLDPLELFCWSVLGQDTSEPEPTTGNTQEIHGYLSC